MIVYLLQHDYYVEGLVTLGIFATERAARDSIIAPHDRYCCSVEAVEVLEGPLPPEPLPHGPWLPEGGALIPEVVLLRLQEIPTDNGIYRTRLVT